MSITLIPLAKLAVSPRNVRKIGNEKFDDLKVSIRTLGLLQNLQVIPVGKGKKAAYEVIAGGRRLQALRELAAEDHLSEDYEVPCQIVADKDATEISLAENAIRQEMHPADQFEAFKKLVDEGKCAVDIAARFDVTETTVLRRLKLASVSPALFDLYRQAKMTLEQLMAYTVCDDHEKQEAVWEAFKDSPRTNPSVIRRALTENRIEADDSRTKYIGEEAYIAAGGSITRDLFSEDVYFDDAALLNRLTHEKLSEYAAVLKNEGWKWVEIDMHDAVDYSAFGRIYSASLPLSDQEREHLEQLEGKQMALAEAYEKGDMDDDEAQEKSDALEAAISAIRERKGYPQHDKARAGVVLCLNDNGTLNSIYGLVRPEDRTMGEVEQDKIATVKRGGEKPRISAPLRESLTAHRTVAIRTSLLDSHDEAMTALLQTLVCDVFYGASKQKALTLRVHHADVGRSCETIAECPAMQRIHTEKMHWQASLPAHEVDLWPWLDALDDEQKKRLLTFCVSGMVNTTISARGLFQIETKAEVLLTRLKINMADWWKPTAENYFSRISMKQIAEAVREVCGNSKGYYITHEKKRQAVTSAEKMLAESRWLPPELRGDGYSLEEVGNTAEAEDDDFSLEEEGEDMEEDA